MNLKLLGKLAAEKLGIGIPGMPHPIAFGTGAMESSGIDAMTRRKLGGGAAAKPPGTPKPLVAPKPGANPYGPGSKNTLVKDISTIFSRNKSPAVKTPQQQGAMSQAWGLGKGLLGSVATPIVAGQMVRKALPVAAGAGGMAGMGISTIANAGLEGVDMAGGLPEWLGGHGMGNYGTHNRQFSADTTPGSLAQYPGAAFSSWMNPIKSLGHFAAAPVTGGMDAYTAAKANLKTRRMQGVNTFADPEKLLQMQPDLWHRAPGGSVKPRQAYMEGGVDPTTWGRLAATMGLPQDQAAYRPEQ